MIIPSTTEIFTSIRGRSQGLKISVGNKKSSKSTQNEISIEDESSTEALIFQTGTVMCTYQLDDILLWRGYWIKQCDN